MNQNTEINYCPCCGTNLRAVSIALGFAANPTASAPAAPVRAQPNRLRSSPSPVEKPARSRTTVDDWLEQQIVTMAETGKFTRPAIAKKMGCSKSTVVRTLQKLRPELVQARTKVPVKTSARITDEERAKVLALKKTGQGPTAIATALSMPVKRVHGIIYAKS